MHTRQIAGVASHKMELLLHPQGCITNCMIYTRSSSVHGGVDRQQQQEDMLTRTALVDSLQYTTLSSSSVYNLSPFSDRVGLPLHKIPSP